MDGCEKRFERILFLYPLDLFVYLFIYLYFVCFKPSQVSYVEGGNRGFKHIYLCICF